MLNRIVALALALSLAICASATATDATSTWNGVASNYNFQRTDQALLGATYAQAYYGPDFAVEFAAIKAYVSSVCGSPIMDPDGDERMDTHLQNWN